MLSPQSDRLEFGSLLAPPSGYELDLAVGTSYSLSLDALVALSLAIGLDQETDSLLMQNPVCILESLRRITSKLVLFCDAAQIQVPDRAKSLHVLLENVVFPVCTRGVRGRGTAFPAFHPKFWLIRFSQKEGLPRYRIAALSRNLTFDHSWDVGCSLEGEQVERKNMRSQPVCDFVSWLFEQLPQEAQESENGKKMRELIQELAYVKFRPEEPFTDVEFLATGITNERGRTRLVSQTGLGSEYFQDLLIISPFLSASVLKSFLDPDRREGRGRNLLISRRAALQQVGTANLQGYEILVLRDRIIDGETALSDEENDEYLTQDIHAKLYLLAARGQSWLFLGSHNATQSAFSRNVEFSIGLSASSRKLSFNKLKQALLGPDPEGPGAFFETPAVEQLQTVPVAETVMRKLQTCLAGLVRSDWWAEAFAENDAWTIVLHVPLLPDVTSNVTVKPYLGSTALALAGEMRFAGLLLQELSEFYIVRIEEGEEKLERLVRIPTKGLPEERVKAVVRNVVSSTDSFYDYVTFLLKDLAALDLLGGRERGSEGEPVNAVDRIRRKAGKPAIYELLLRTAAEAPENLEGLQMLMASLAGDDVIPQEFRELWDSFNKAVNNDGKSSGAAR